MQVCKHDRDGRLVITQLVSAWLEMQDNRGAVDNARFWGACSALGCAVRGCAISKQLQLLHLHQAADVWTASKYKRWDSASPYLLL